MTSPDAESANNQSLIPWVFLQAIVQGIEATEVVPGRCEVIDEDQEFGVIIDSASSPTAISRLLDSVRDMGPRRIILIVGCEGEVDRTARPFIGEIAHYKVSFPLLPRLPSPPSGPPPITCCKLHAEARWGMGVPLQWLSYLAQPAVFAAGRLVWIMVPWAVAPALVFLAGEGRLGRCPDPK